jgi:HlyD family secretion protein
MATNGKKSRKKIIIFSLLALVIIALLFIVFFAGKREPIITVQVEKVKARTITQVVTATGKIQPEVQVKISPEVSGEIVSLPVKEGDRVKKGDLLLKIKADVYAANRDQYTAGLMQTKANLDKSQAEFRRIESLYAKGLVSQSEFDIAKAAYESSQASYAQARASLNQAEENLRKTTVFAPMDGTVSQLNSELGERVLGTAQFQGTEVMTIADLSRMEARVDVSENDVTLIHLGDTARVSVDAFPDKKVNAVVYEIANTAKTRGLGTQEELTNFTVKMRIVDKAVNLRPGMSMTADIETQTKTNVLSVPIQSVTVRAPKPEMKPGDGPPAGGTPVVQASGEAKPKAEKPREIVFVVDKGVAKTVFVKRGISSDAYVEITEGVTDSMDVVSGSYKAINRELEDGMKVHVEEPKKMGGPTPAEGTKQ